MVRTSDPQFGSGLPLGIVSHSASKLAIISIMVSGFFFKAAMAHGADVWCGRSWAGFAAAHGGPRLACQVRRRPSLPRGDEPDLGSYACWAGALGDRLDTPIRRRAGDHIPSGLSFFVVVVHHQDYAFPMKRCFVRRSPGEGFESSASIAFAFCQRMSTRLFALFFIFDTTGEGLVGGRTLLWRAMAINSSLVFPNACDRLIAPASGFVLR